VPKVVRSAAEFLRCKINDSMIGFLVGPASAVIFAFDGIPLDLRADRWST